MNIVRIDPTRARPAAQPEHFDGTVRMQPLYEPDRDGEESELVAVFFDAGARTTPHTHDSHQVLQVVFGHCLVVVEDDRQIAGPGDFVIVPRGTWHWHGATREGPACHISIKLPGRTHWGVPRRNWAAG
ncbi:MAG: cupin domain-containing protein [Armatimonadota bacterium]|nr:cupin domain-containing protein [Armatimonadota bacterium]